MQLKFNIKCLSKLSFTSTNYIKHCIKLVSLLTISRRKWKLKKKNSLQGWGYINLYSFELIVQRESIAISNEALKYYKNFIQITFANKFKAEDLETEIQQTFEWIGANNLIMGHLGR